jgi:hypothetical protein
MLRFSLLEGVGPLLLLKVILRVSIRDALALNQFEIRFLMVWVKNWHEILLLLRLGKSEF